MSASLTADERKVLECLNGKVLKYHEIRTKLGWELETLSTVLGQLRQKELIESGSEGYSLTKKGRAVLTVAA